MDDCGSIEGVDENVFPGGGISRLGRTGLKSFLYCSGRADRQKQRDTHAKKQG